jgi:pimeloyl-ACP methyl ester carboxylesterase
MSSAPAMPLLTHNFAAAADGAELSYYSIGNGPGIVVVHGAMSYALTHKDLAVALSPYFTVNIFSRRTRGLSGPFPSSITNSTTVLSTDKTDSSDQSTMRIANRTVPRAYSLSYSSAVLQTEASDLHTILKTTSSHFVISISSGALITLSYLLTYPSPECLVKKAILFEPAVQFSDLDKPSSLPTSAGRGIAQYEERRAAGDILGALVAALKATGMVPGWIPEWVLKGGMRWRAAQKKTDKGGQQGEDEGVKDPLKLAEALRYDFCAGEAMIGDSERFRKIKGAEVLLMGGTESQGYLQEGMGVLGELIVGSKKVVIQGLNHNGLGQKEGGGKPERAVDEVLAFFRGVVRRGVEARRSM